MRRSVIAVLILAGISLTASDAYAQCVFSNTSSSTFGPTKIIFKTFTMPQSCVQTTGNANCYPGATPMTVFALTASARTTVTMMPSCGWNCGCGTVVIDGSDGLPVELLSFDVIDGGDAVDTDTEAESQAEEPTETVEPKPPSDGGTKRSSS